MRFLLDENVPIPVGRFLQEQGYDVLIVRHSPLTGSSDEELWRQAVQDQRVIVTHDRHFPLQGRIGLPAGVILIRPYDNRPAAIESLFRGFWSAVSPEEIEGRVISVRAGRYRIHRLR